MQILREILIVQGIVTLILGLYTTSIGLSIGDHSEVTGNQILEKINNLENKEDQMNILDKSTLTILGILLTLTSLLEIMGLAHSFFRKP